MAINKEHDELELSKRYGIHRLTIRWRLRNGWSLDEAVNRKPHLGNKDLRKKERSDFRINICSVENCANPVTAKGLCGKHRHRQIDGKSLTAKSRYEKTIEERFWDKVDKRGPDECWNWTGGTCGRDHFIYGSMKEGGRATTAHRFSYALAYGPIPQSADPRDHCVCHHCDNTLCVNPGHLFIGTHKDNMQDKMNKGRDPNKNKTHCKHGHERTMQNIYIDKRGSKSCRVCERIRDKKRAQTRQSVAYPG